MKEYQDPISRLERWGFVFCGVTEGGMEKLSVTEPRSGKERIHPVHKTAHKWNLFSQFLTLITQYWRAIFCVYVAKGLERKVNGIILGFCTIFAFKHGR